MNRKMSHSLSGFEAVLSGLDKRPGDPGRTPTCDLGFRKALLYAAELRGRHGSSLAGRTAKGKAGSVEKAPGKKILAINPR